MKNIAEWRIIAGFERYEVSNTGKVRSLYMRGGARRSTPFELSTPVHRIGYRRVCLYGSGGARSVELVHRLVALAFVEGNFPGAFVLHRDGRKLNNDARNLRFGTALENIIDSASHGRTYRPLSPDDVRFIRSSALSRVELAGIFNMTPGSISACALGHTYREVVDF
jgi:hypothetical protein